MVVAAAAPAAKVERLQGWKGRKERRRLNVGELEGSSQLRFLPLAEGGQEMAGDSREILCHSSGINGSRDEELEGKQIK